MKNSNLYGSFIVYKINDMLYRSTIANTTDTHIIINISGNKLYFDFKNIKEGHYTDCEKLKNNHVIVLKRLSNGYLNKEDQNYLNQLPRYK